MHKRTTGILFLLLIIAALSSCDIYKSIRKYVDRKYSRNGIRSTYHKKDNYRVKYFQGGEGPLLLLIHGFGGNAEYTWLKQAPKFSQDFTVLFPDLFYFGDSFMPTNEFSLELQADIIADLISESGRNKAHVLGLSYGGIIASILTERHPDLVDRLVLVDSPALSADESHLADIREIFGTQDITGLLEPRDWQGLKKTFQLVNYKERSIPDSILQAVHRDLYGTMSAERIWLLGELSRPRQTAVDKSKNKEVLIIWGEFDRLFTECLPYKLQADLGDKARLYFIKDAAHAPNFEKDREFNRKVKEFLEGSPVL